ncbi:MAG: phosphate transport system regulatory protein PhoU [Phycisphaerae bacterium]|nr:MAG: phosphate transport system regulatory protein PhoU [Phycisphaerae bacterium]
MSHHFADLLDTLKARIARMTALVQDIVEKSVDSVVNLDDELARTVMSADDRIDEEEVNIEKQAIDLLALYQPAASDLRAITMIIKVNGDFERIADCAVNVAQRVPLLAKMGDYIVSSDLRLMANTVVTNLRDCINAYNLSDLDLAKQVLRSDDVLDALYHQIVQETLGVLESQQHRANRDLSTIMIAKNLERIGDHCTNIAEDIIYVQSGRIIRHRHAV